MKPRWYFVKSSIWSDLRNPTQQLLYLTFEELNSKIKSCNIIMLIPL